MNKFNLVCGLVLISLLSVKVESSGFYEINEKVNATLTKVNEVENGANIELTRVDYTMRGGGYLRSNIEIMENKVKTFCTIVINEQFYLDHAKVTLRCIPEEGELKDIYERKYEWPLKYYSDYISSTTTTTPKAEDSI